MKFTHTPPGYASHLVILRPHMEEEGSQGTIPVRCNFGKSQRPVLHSIFIHNHFFSFKLLVKAGYEASNASLGFCKDAAGCRIPGRHVKTVAVRQDYWVKGAAGTLVRPMCWAPSKLLPDCSLSVDLKITAHSAATEDMKSFDTEVTLTTVASMVP